MTTTLLPRHSIIVTPDGEKAYVLRDCGEGSNRAMYCVTCRYEAPNAGMMRAHCKGEGDHHLVSYCPRHRTYEVVTAKAQESAA